MIAMDRGFAAGHITADGAASAAGGGGRLPDRREHARPQGAAAGRTGAHIRKDQVAMRYI